MKICPKCGYREEPIWLNHQFQQHIDYARVEDFRKHYPKLADHLKKPGDIIRDEFYFYRLTTSSPFVYRWLKELGSTAYHVDYEKHKKRDHLQQKLCVNPHEKKAK